MKQLVMLLVAAIGLAAGTVAAQTPQEVQASVDRVMSPKAPCNQGPEPFSQFIQSFTTDSAYMASRLRLPQGQQERFAAILADPANFSARSSFTTPEESEPQVRIWDEAQGNKVYLSWAVEDSYVLYTFLFQRADGRWYLASITAED